MSNLSSASSLFGEQDTDQANLVRKRASRFQRPQVAAPMRLTERDKRVIKDSERLPPDPPGSNSEVGIPIP